MAKCIQILSVLLLMAVSSLASPQDGPSSITGHRFSTTGSDVKLLLVNTGTLVEPVVVEYMSADGTVLRTEDGLTLMPSTTKQFSATDVPSETTDIVVRASATVRVSPASTHLQALAAHSPPALEPVQAAPADTGQTGLAYFVGQQDAIQADAARLQAEMDDLEKRYAADPNAKLRDEIRAREAFVARMQTERAEARRFVSPTLAVALDWVARDAQEAANARKADLDARLRVPNPERAALKAQIDRLQQEIDRKAKLAELLADKIKSLRDDRRREEVVSELDALAKTAGGSSLTGAAATTVIVLDKEKQR